MTHESEIEYLVRRAKDELDRAEASRDPIAAQIHRQLARAYGAKVAALRESMPRGMTPPSAMLQPSIIMR